MDRLLLLKIYFFEPRISTFKNDWLCHIILDISGGTSPTSLTKVMGTDVRYLSSGDGVASVHYVRIPPEQKSRESCTGTVQRLQFPAQFLGGSSELERWRAGRDRAVSRAWACESNQDKHNWSGYCHENTKGAIISVVILDIMANSHLLRRFL